MNEEKKNRYFYMALGHIGLFLFGLSMFRYLVVHDDIIGQSMSLFGFLMLTSYIGFLEEKFGVTEKEARITKVTFTVVLLIVALLFYPPWKV